MVDRCSRWPGSGGVGGVPGVGLSVSQLLTPAVPQTAVTRAGSHGGCSFGFSLL